MKEIFFVFIWVILFTSCANPEETNPIWPLLRTEYTFEAEDIACLKISDTRVEVHQAGKLIKAFKTFSVYLDQFGYKSIKLDNDIFTVIDGANKYFIITHNNNWNRQTSFIDLPIDMKAHSVYPSYYNEAMLNGYAIEEIVASSELKDDTTTYYATNVLKTYGEGDVFWYWVKNNSVWAEGVDGNGIGESLEFSIKKPDRSDTIFDIILYIINGYVDPEKPSLFYANNRIRKAKLVIDSVEEIEIEFNDYVEMKEVSLPRSASKVKLIIQSVYPGSKYNDTCLTSLDIRFKQAK